MQTDRKSVGQLQSDNNEYGCLMVKFNIPWWNKFVSNIKRDDIYDHEEYGIERESHVTILYGFDDSVTSDVIRKYVEKMSITINIKLKDISSFTNDNFDVLKFDVICESLHKLNGFFKKLPHVDTYPDYHPHMTIAYLKPGLAKKYICKLNNNITLSSHEFVFSDKFGNKTLMNK